MIGKLKYYKRIHDLGIIGVTPRVKKWEGEFEVYINRKWVRTEMIFDKDWELKGTGIIGKRNMDGLRIRDGEDMGN